MVSPSLLVQVTFRKGPQASHQGNALEALNRDKRRFKLSKRGGYVDGHEIKQLQVATGTFYKDIWTAIAPVQLRIR